METRGRGVGDKPIDSMGRSVLVYVNEGPIYVSSKMILFYSYERAK